MSKPFTDEQNQWLKDNYGCSYKELTERFNARFGTSYKWLKDGYSPIERRCRKMGLFRNKGAYGFTKEEDEWLKKYAERYSNHWLAENIEKVSGRKHTEEAIKMHIREWLGISKGNGGIREDTIQTYKKPLGSICSWGKTHVRIKLYDTGDDKVDWYPYGRYIYEQFYNVKLPKNIQVIHLDGDNTNFAIENLLAISHQEHAILTANKWHKKGEVTKTGVYYAKVTIALKGE